MESTDPTKSLDWYNAEMEDCATGYANFIMKFLENAKQTCSDPVVLIEQRVDFSRWVEQSFGTSDPILNFKLPPLLEDSEIEVILSHIDELVSWANDIKEYALQQAISGKEWTGWKLVEGRSNRRYTNEDAVSKAVEVAGFDPYEKKLLGITAMQKLLGKSRFEELLAAYIEKPQGKPTLVPESDKRPAMNTAKNDFMEEYDNE